MTSPLHNLTYRRLFTAQVISLAGTGLTTVALALFAYDLAGEDAGTVLGTALALKMVAYVCFAPLVGAFANRLSRKSLLITLDLVRGLIVLAIPFITEIWQIYVLIFLLNACSAGFTPTFQATIPEILPDDGQYTRALSLSRLGYDLENLFSPLFAAAALMVMSYDVLFSINAATFLISALLIFSIRHSFEVTEENDSGWRDVTFGLRAYLATPRLRSLLALCLAVSAAGAMVIINTVVYVRVHHGGTEVETAYAFAAYGAGSMIAALVLPRFLDRFPDRPFMLSGAAALCVGLFLPLFQPDFTGLLVIWFILGVGSSLIQTPSGRLLKRSSNTDNRPALYAAHFALSHGCWLFTYPLAGWIGGLFGLNAAFALLGLISLASLIAAHTSWPVNDRIEQEHTHDAIEHDHLHTHDEHHQHHHDEPVENEPHRHMHVHSKITHKHEFVIDLHHTKWPG